MKRAYVLIVVIVAVVGASLLSSSLAYRRGYQMALDHQKARLIITLDALEQIDAGDVDGARRLTESVLFRTANEFLEDERYQSDPDIRALMPRLTKYWDTHCADRPQRLPMEERFGSLLAQRR